VLDAVILLLILDTYLYWGHVMMHKIPALWEIHKIHHAAYAPNFHLLEFMILWLIPMAIAWLCGFTITIFIVSFLFIYEVSLTHRKTYKTSNRIHRWIFKPFKSWLGNAKYHKVHHDYPDKNLTQMFTHWDYIMKTRYNSKDGNVYKTHKNSKAS